MVTEEKRKVVETYNKGLVYYKQRKFDLAVQSFQEALKIDPADGPSKLYLSRASEFVKNPPPEDWDGVFIMTTK
ncbi:MAG: tetratricopeptide repeat protein [Spirochaetes bacterium]|nr:tetratricopeptide repeat protein [Spirochaetota bacterium]